MPDRVRTHRADGPGRHGLTEAVAIVLVLAAVGVLAGLVWEWLWEPSIGVAFGGDWVPLNALEAKSAFSATGWYVVVGVAAGLLAGVGIAMVLDQRPLLTLAAVVLGSVLAGWLMTLVGGMVGPPDPELLARAAPDGTRLPAQLSVSGWSPRAAFPVGALLGLVVVFLGFGPRRSATRPQSTAGPVDSIGADSEASR